MPMRPLLLVLLLSVVGVFGQSKYFIGKTGDSCAKTCHDQQMNCNSHIVTNDSVSLFNSLGVQCNTSSDTNVWWAEDQPSFVAVSSDKNYGRCVGFQQVPGGVYCGGQFPTTQRLCRCDLPSKTFKAFGTGLSSGFITNETEQWVFQHYIADGDYGVMTHFWNTYMTSVDDGVVIRYYIDGVKSIEFTPSLACGTGFYDNTAPWGTKWFGKGAKDGAWFLNFKIPFQKSVVVTAQHKYGTYGGFYMIVRGGTNIPIMIGDIPVPSTARLSLFTTKQTFQPLDYITLANIGPGISGLFFMHTLQVQSRNLNFLEGCYHMYTSDQEFPGTVLSTGTEDYFDSAWYFNAGEFRLPVSGFTHINTTDGVEWSAYRFHEMDALQFSDGFQLVWRNGDTVDPAGMKCFMEAGTGRVVGSPTQSNVTALAWAYTWQ